jgi:hypothetical protein
MTAKTDWKAFDAKLIARAWEDEAFKAALLSNPSQAIAQAGLTVPEGTEIRVVEQSSDKGVKEKPGVHYLILPPKPKRDEAEESELSEDELSFVAGGWDPPSGTTQKNPNQCKNYNSCG